MRITNIYNLPEAIVRAVSVERHNKPNHLSATTLLKGIKQIILEERHWDELEEDVSNRLWAIWGSVTHKLLEYAGENEVIEKYLEYDVKGLTITGRIDNYNTVTRTLTDYKTCASYKVKTEDFDDWRNQCLIYTWLLEKLGNPVKKVKVIGLVKDHSKREAESNPKYPQHPIYVYGFDVTEKELEEAENLIHSRIDLYLQARNMEDDEVLPCTAKERWVNKKGENVRCNAYCSCNRFCNFYKELEGDENV